jgi:hypothetical protein
MKESRGAATISPKILESYPSSAPRYVPGIRICKE